MKTNEQIQKDVQAAIAWEPLLNAAEIGVIVKDGLVTLTGVVDSYVKKFEAEEAAKNVIGVIAVLEQIEIRFAEGHTGWEDDAIAREAVRALRWNWEVPDKNIQVTVEDGWLTIAGKVQCNYQRLAAEKSVHALPGVKGVTNNIYVATETQDGIEQRNIAMAFQRSSALHNLQLDIKVTGNNVALSGIVNSIYEKAEAERLAWNAPGVKTVTNNLTVNYAEHASL